MVDVCYLWGLFRTEERPLHDSVARCDFCHRQVQIGRGVKEIDFKDWSPEQRVPALLAKLGIVEPSDLPRTMSNARLHALLSSVQEATAANRFQLSPVGVIVGAIIGALAAIPVGMWLAGEKIALIDPEGVGKLCATCILGGVVGLILGGFVEKLLRPDRRPFLMIAQTHASYRLDLPRLRELSETYSGPVRKAVKQVCAKPARETR
jgi:hypothetical protein